MTHPVLIEYLRSKGFVRWLQDNQPAIYTTLYVAWFRRHFKPNWKYLRGSRNRISSKGAAINGARFSVVGDSNTIDIKSHAVLERVRFHIRGNRNRITIGSNCAISDSVLWIEDDCCEISIGSGTTIGGAHLAATESESRISIGADCMLAYDIDVRTGDSHGIYDSLGMRINSAENVTVADHVWVAAHSTILKGAEIGTGSIVATGSVVVRGSYPPSAIIAGNPARPVKLCIRWTRSRQERI